MVGTTKSWRVDAHVHLHESPPSAALVARLADGAHVGADARPGLVWCLTDLPGVETFEALSGPAFAGAMDAIGADVAPAGPAVVRASSPRWTLHLIDGEQLVSSEGLEVLVVGGKLRPDARAPVRSILERALAAGLVPILPWGVGKWLGARGRTVSELVAEPAWRGRVALADSGTRPGLWPRPRQLDAARERGLAVLHGSDSLRVPGDQARTGRVGALVPATTSDGPLADLRAHVRAPSAPEHFGAPMAAAGFVRCQALLRLNRA